MRRIFLDTSYIVALVNRRNELHERSRELMVRYEDNLLLTTDAILLEIGNSLARHQKEKAIEVIDDFFDSSDIEIVRLNSELFERAFDLYKTHVDKAWGLVDCRSFVVMRENSVTDVLTGDRHFIQAGFNALMLDPIS